MSGRLQDFHSGERAQFYKLFFRTLIFGGPLLVIGEAMAVYQGWISPWWLPLLVVLDVVVLWFYCQLQYHLMHTAAEGFTKMVLAGGNLPPDPAHSGFESLVIRGFYQEAAEAYRKHLATHPRDHLARIKLAELCLQHLGQPGEAERLYLEIRQGQPSPKEERLATNLLMELYRKQGRRDRLMVELARFAHQHKGTRAAREAARALMEMKQELAKD